MAPSSQSLFGDFGQPLTLTEIQITIAAYEEWNWRVTRLPAALQSPVSKKHSFGKNDTIAQAFVMLVLSAQSPCFGIDVFLSVVDVEDVPAGPPERVVSEDPSTAGAGTSPVLSVTK
ncbi:hypothetical protein FIBSPDRAFT_1022243 [Athelia psychrophila]|uniref:Uncharacterized protein n=1 Tax=Athelia psychrophila TaxID=1759441 RepID=A0A166JC98_9AGAM|nr:hypothetical protein FIBSPDRAFT_1022243 [Fibularhizoctonia sp. CBS 109695]